MSFTKISVLPINSSIASFTKISFWNKASLEKPRLLMFPCSGILIRSIIEPKIGLLLDRAIYLGIRKVEPEADKFIVTHSLQPHVENACRFIRDALSQERISGWTADLRVARDIESPDWSALSIEVELPVEEYSRVLDIWTRVGKDFYGALDPAIAKKVYIILRKKSRLWYGV